MTSNCIIWREKLCFCGYSVEGIEMMSESLKLLIDPLTNLNWAQKSFLACNDKFQNFWMKYTNSLWMIGSNFDMKWE